MIFFKNSKKDRRNPKSEINNEQSILTQEELKKKIIREIIEEYVRENNIE